MIIRISEKDNVGVALSSLRCGTAVGLLTDFTIDSPDGRPMIMVLAEIPAGHKIAIADIPAASPVIKYGQPIGYASADIHKGEHVHSHNLKSALTGNEDYSYNPVAADRPSADPSDRTFMGYRRQNGKIGIRNEIWILPTVGCINGTIRNLEKRSARQYSSIEGIDGIYGFEHPYGCSQLGDDLSDTRDILRGLALHPNAGGVLLVGLGCENNRLSGLVESLGDFDRSRIRFMECQTIEDEMEEGMRLIGELCSLAAADQRTSMPIDGLVVGLKCGGSDAFSGITANPLLGELTNRLVAAGASAVMAEVPEMFGAERLLMARCVDEAIYAKTVDMIQSYQNYFTGHDVAVYENPSPGNKEGGITTLEEKSLGCILKSGDAPVSDVIRYGGQIEAKGLSLLYSPGNDLVSCTALVAAGAQLICFTTGRGTPYGSPVPTLKIASGSRLAGYKSGWIDYDAGRLSEGGDFAGHARELLDLILDIASDKKKTKNEISGHRDIAIFKNGVTL
ncbi:MAG: UxaA family hydrolase [Saccharofermentanales bacterium]